MSFWQGLFSCSHLGKMAVSSLEERTVTVLIRGPVTSGASCPTGSPITLWGDGHCPAGEFQAPLRH